MKVTKRHKIFTFVTLAFVIFSALSFTGVYAAQNWDTWTGQAALDEVSLIAEEMVIQINEGDAAIALLEGQITTLENEATILQAQLDTLLAQSGNKLQQIADLTAALTAMTIERDALQVDLDNMTAERDQLVLDLQGMTDERDWLAVELATANQAVIDFETGICAQVDLIHSNHKRAAYDTWCGVRP